MHIQVERFTYPRESMFFVPFENAIRSIQRENQTQCYTNFGDEIRITIYFLFCMASGRDMSTKTGGENVRKKDRQTKTHTERKRGRKRMKTV